MDDPDRRPPQYASGPGVTGAGGSTSRLSVCSVGGHRLRVEPQLRQERAGGGEDDQRGDAANDRDVRSDEERVRDAGRPVGAGEPAADGGGDAAEDSDA